MPAGQLTRIDRRVSMAADNRTLTIKFIGGPVLLPTDPCYTGYEGWARLTAGDLDLAVILVSDVHPAPGTACAAVGEERVVTVTLDAPFLGSTATDVSDGHTVEVERLPSRREGRAAYSHSARVPGAPGMKYGHSPGNGEPVPKSRK